MIPTAVYLRQGLLFLRRRVLWVLRAWLVVIVWLVILPAWNIGALFFMSLLSDLMWVVLVFGTSCLLTVTQRSESIP